MLRDGSQSEADIAAAIEAVRACPTSAHYLHGHSLASNTMFPHPSSWVADGTLCYYLSWTLCSNLILHCRMTGGAGRAHQRP